MAFCNVMFAGSAFPTASSRLAIDHAVVLYRRILHAWQILRTATSASINFFITAHAYFNLD